MAGFNPAIQGHKLIYGRLPWMGGSSPPMVN